MMRQYIYPNIISRLKFQCELFFRREISPEDIQAEIQGANSCIVALEEKWLNKILINASNDIEEYLYTLSEKNALYETSIVVQDILNCLSAFENGEEPH